MKNPYEILEIKKTATYEEVKSAYRRLSKLYHPDLNDGQYNEKMVEINAAYEFLEVEYLKNSKTSSSNSTNSYNDMNDFEKTDRWRAFWAKWEAQKKADYKNQCIKMRAKIERNLEPIRQENKKFITEIEKAKSYEELLKVSQYYTAKIEDMIISMYRYTENNRRYGMPPMYSFGMDKTKRDVFTINDVSLLNVKSSYISAVGYNNDKQVLFVRFVNGDLYAYYDVLSNIYNDFINSTSLGSYFLKTIKDYYESMRVN